MRTLFLISLLFTLNACGLLLGGVQQKETVEVKSWDPQGVNIECPSGDCPEAVGLLVTKKSLDSGYRLGRCTASLIESNKILTNAHCFGLTDGYDVAYFIVPVQGSKEIRRVTTILAKTASKEGATGRDHAIALLDRPVTGMKPKSVARSIPSNLSSLVGYVINQKSWDTDFAGFNLDKRVCQVKSDYKLFGLGLENRNESLALFDCEMKQGNSGAPLFAPNDFQNIQVLLWGINLKAEGNAKTLRFAMAERVHCLDYPGLAAPEVLCDRYSPLKVIRGLVKDANENYLQWAKERVSRNGIVYEFAVALGTLNQRGQGRGGLAMVVGEIPKCREAGNQALLKTGIVPTKISFFETGVSPDSGGIDIKEVDSREFSFRFYPIDSETFERQSSLLFSLDVPASFEIEAGKLTEFKLLFISQKVKLPVCTGNEVTESLEQFKAALN